MCILQSIFSLEVAREVCLCIEERKNDPVQTNLLNPKREIRRGCHKKLEKQTNQTQKVIAPQNFIIEFKIST